MAVGVDAAVLARRGEVLAMLAPDAPAIPATDNSSTAWAERLQVAGSRLHPWIAFQVERLGSTDRLPVPTRTLLGAAVHASVLADLLRRTTFAAWADTLDGAEIPFVVLKGMAIAEALYPRASARTMADVDLWVRPQDRDATVRALATLGWVIPARYVRHVRNVDGAMILAADGAPFVLELHTWPPSLARDASTGMAVWGRCVQRTIAQRVVRVCGTSDQLVHIAVHLARRHGFSDGLRALLDLSLCARLVGDEDEWVRLGTDHRERRVAVWTSFSLRLARDLLGAQVPSAYFRAAGVPPPTAGLLEAAHVQLWDRRSRSVHDVDALMAGDAVGKVLSYLKRYYLAPGSRGQAWWRELPPRLYADLTVRIRRYAKALRRGELGGERLAQGARMARERDALIAAMEAESPAPSAPR